MSRAEIIALCHGNDLILTTIKTPDEAVRIAKAYYPNEPYIELARLIFAQAHSEQYAGWRKNGKRLSFFGRRVLYSRLEPLF